MPKPATTLKTKNALYLWSFIAANWVVFFAIMIAAKLDYTSMNGMWHRIAAKDGMIAACMPIFTIILNGLLGDQAKARLVFWRWKDPLPGCRVFSELIHADPRIDIKRLKEKLGGFPRSAKEQNVAWFQVYKRQAKSVVVNDSHRLYLLTRDMAALSVVFAIAFPLGAIWSTTSWSLQVGYFIGLLVQFAMISTSARNYGNRFALNVLTEESQAK